MGVATGGAGMSPTARDLNVALAMNGGVSLAVWIGGVSSEFYRATRGEGLYGALEQFVDTSVVIDVMTGASAGGLNGVFLAAATTRDLPATAFDELRDVWLSVGSFSNLLRNPATKDPPSVLKGDEVFLAEAGKVLARWMAAPAVAAPDGRTDIELVMTASTLDPVPTRATDAAGNRIVDPRHRARFTFTGARLRGADAALTARQLARAARTSASFPGAFEPSFVSVGAGDAVDPDMIDIASFGQSMWAVDGGVLVNKPVGPALELIARHRSDRPGDRILVYINPDPGTSPEPPAAVRDSPPSFGMVIAKSLFSLPRAESLAEELAIIDEYNRKFGLRRRLRESLLLGVSTGGDTEARIDLVDLATQLYPIWLRRDGIASADAIVASHLRSIGRTFADPIGPNESRSWVSAANAIRMARGRADLLDGQFLVATAAATDVPWRYGARAVEAAAATVADMVQRALDLVAPGALDQRLAIARARLDDCRARSAEARNTDLQWWAVRLQAGVPDEGLAEWADQSFAQLGDAALHLTPVLTEIVHTLRDALPDLRAAAVEAHQRNFADTDDTNPPTRILTRLVSSLATGNPDAADLAHIDDDHAIIRRLLALFVIQDISDDEPGERPSLTFVQVAATTVCPIDPGRTPTEKVRGLSLGHFGGFLKSSWRANDWMWGRLDGATHLAALLVTPARLRQCYVSQSECVDALATMLASEPRLGLDVADIIAAIGDELAFLDGANRRRLPARLPRTLQLVASALVRLAAADELPVVADAIERSQREGASAVPEALEFVRQVAAVREPAGRVPVAAVDRLVAACRVGGETVGEEIGSDALSRTGLGVAAVASGVLAGKSNSVAPVRAAFAVVRRALAWVYVLLDSMLRGTRTATGIMMTLLAVGGALVTARLLGANIPTGPLVIGMYLLAGFVALVALVVGWRRALGSVGLALALVVVASIDANDATTLFLNPDTPSWKPLVHYVGAALMIAAFAIAAARWRANAPQLLRTGVIAALGWLAIGAVVRYGLQSHRWVDAARWMHDWRAVVIALAIPAAVAVASAGTRLWR